MSHIKVSRFQGDLFRSHCVRGSYIEVIVSESLIKRSVYQRVLYRGQCLKESYIEVGRCRALKRKCS